MYKKTIMLIYMIAILFSLTSFSSTNDWKYKVDINSKVYDFYYDNETFEVSWEGNAPEYYYYIEDDDTHTIITSGITSGTSFAYTLSNDSYIKSRNMYFSVVAMSPEGEKQWADHKTFEIKQKGYVKDIDFEPDEITLEIGNSYQLEAIFDPVDAYNKLLTWESKDSSAVSITNSGYITANKTASEVVILATAHSGRYAKCKVTVIDSKKIPISSILPHQNTIIISVGQSLQLTPLIEPYNATDNELSYSTNSNSIKITQTGVITGVNKNDGLTVVVEAPSGVKCKYEIIVINGDTPSKITEIDIAGKSYDLIVGDTKQLNYGIEPQERLHDAEVIWISSNNRVASVDSYGNVTALSSGVATITAISEELSDTVEINVKNKPLEIYSYKNNIKTNEYQTTMWNSSGQSFSIELVRLSTGNSELYFHDGNSYSNAIYDNLVKKESYKMIISDLDENGNIISSDSVTFTVEPTIIYSTVSGYVTDENMSPIDNAKVTLGNMVHYTNSSGYFIFDDIQNSSYELSISCKDFFISNQTLEVTTDTELGNIRMRSLEPKSQLVDVNFKDVSSSYWGYKYIAEAKSKNLISGYPDNTFRPNEPLTKAAFIKLLTSLHGFTDEAKYEYWAYPYIEHSYFKGWYPESTDRYIEDPLKFLYPFSYTNSLNEFNRNNYSDYYDQPITREDACVLIAKSIDNYSENINLDHKDLIDKFSDYYHIEFKHFDEILFCIDKGITSGYNDGTFRPENELKRIEGLVLLSKVNKIKQDIKNEKNTVKTNHLESMYYTITQSYIGNNTYSFSIKPTSFYILDDLDASVFGIKFGAHKNDLNESIESKDLSIVTLLKGKQFGTVYIQPYMNIEGRTLSGDIIKFHINERNDTIEEVNLSSQEKTNIELLHDYLSDTGLLSFNSINTKISSLEAFKSSKRDQQLVETLVRGVNLASQHTLELKLDKTIYKNMVIEYAYSIASQQYEAQGEYYLDLFQQYSISNPDIIKISDLTSSEYNQLEKLLSDPIYKSTGSVHNLSSSIKNKLIPEVESYFPNLANGNKNQILNLLDEIRTVDGLVDLEEMNKWYYVNATKGLFNNNLLTTKRTYKPFLRNLLDKFSAAVNLTGYAVVSLDGFNEFMKLSYIDDEVLGVLRQMLIDVKDAPDNNPLKEGLLLAITEIENKEIAIPGNIVGKLGTQFIDEIGSANVYYLTIRNSQTLANLLSGGNSLEDHNVIVQMKLLQEAKLLLSKKNDSFIANPNSNTYKELIDTLGLFNVITEKAISTEIQSRYGGLIYYSFRGYYYMFTGKDFSDRYKNALVKQREIMMPFFTLYSEYK